MKAEAAYRDKGNLVAELEEALTLKGIGSMNVCVCSFSENGDLLSQWRAYGGGSGFSIGFPGDFLRAIAKGHSFWLAPVLYEDHDQREFVRTLLNDVLAENLQRGIVQNGDDNDALPIGGNLLAYLNRYAPILKHKSFSEEREWRIITRPMACVNKQFGYREGASMLVPYFRIGLASEQEKLTIKEIVVGPTPHPEQSCHSLQGLLVRQTMKDVTVRNSETPYRNW